MERINVYVLQPTQVAKGKHHNDQRAPKVVLPDQVAHMMHPASDMEGEQTGATFHKIPATIPAGSNGPHRGSCDTDTDTDINIEAHGTPIPIPIPIGVISSLENELQIVAHG